MITTPFDDYIVRHRIGVDRRDAAPGDPGGAGGREGGPGGGPGGAWQEAQRSTGVTITPGRAYGFFTDTTLCIGCKACEVACKQWNHLPADGFDFRGATYDHTGDLSDTTWRHVVFVEQFDEDRFDGRGPATSAPPRARANDGGAVLAPADVDLATDVELAAAVEPWGNLTRSEAWASPGARWMFLSDVCKHCVRAPCLEACPTGSIIRTEFDSVYIQQDVCNGCGYCVPACPFGVVEVSKESDGKAHKCTFCYDRLKDGMEPACSKSCPTDSILFGPVDELLERAKARVAELRERGIPAYLYGSNGVLEDDCDTGALDGLNAFFLLIDKPEVYNLPPVPHRPSSNTAKGLAVGAFSALALAGITMAAVASGREAK